MEETRSSTWHYGIRAVLAAALCYYIVQLVQSEHLIYYIAPRMQLYVKLSAIALFLLAVHQAYKAVQSRTEQEPDCECGHEMPRSVWRSLLLYGLFGLPLALGFVLPDQWMGSRIASIKGMNLSASTATLGAAPASVSSAGLATTSGAAAVVVPAASPVPTPSSSASPSPVADASSVAAPAASADDELKKLFHLEDFNEAYSIYGLSLYKQDLIRVEEVRFLETMTTLDLFMDPLMGKRVEISGFVYRDGQMNAQQFVVARLAMQCCSADSVPYGILIETPNASSYAEDSWVKVTGVLGKTKLGEYAFMKLDAKQIVKIEVPKSPYVYPDYSFFD
ncbi:TIGR03943 family putative permease subunit [Paenibacillus koleovorans]|uniref:TIGR03943 family putative permease subunit n=1 Tax=Paenibacillus koleovorans TaxID=121608 RepID=UPI000FD87A8D|nr:TIGR03943 family protein [Paenibacillus koleovorans]